MQSKLSDLADNLSGINNNKNKSCLERKKIKSECNFIGFRNNILNYKCKPCISFSDYPSVLERPSS